jgi:hypothetical protein
MLIVLAIQAVLLLVNPRKAEELLKAFVIVDLGCLIFVALCSAQ